MAFAPRFAAEQIADDGAHIAVSILEDGFTGDVVYLDLVGDGVTIESEAPDADSVYRAMIAHTCTLELSGLDTAGEDPGLWAWLETLEEHTAVVRVERTDPVTTLTETWFVGWVEPVMEGRPLEPDAHPQDVTLSASCGLSRLKSLPTPLPAGDPTPDVGVAAMIVALLRRTGLGLPVYIAIEWATPDTSPDEDDASTLDGLIMPSSALKDGRGYALDAERALGEIATALHLVVTQGDGAWHVYERSLLGRVALVGPPGGVSYQAQPFARYAYTGTSVTTPEPAGVYEEYDPFIVYDSDRSDACRHPSMPQPRIARLGSVAVSHGHGTGPAPIRNGDFSGRDTDLPRPLDFGGLGGFNFIGTPVVTSVFDVFAASGYGLYEQPPPSRAFSGEFWNQVIGGTLSIDAEGLHVDFGEVVESTDGRYIRPFAGERLWLRLSVRGRGSGDKAVIYAVVATGLTGGVYYLASGDTWTTTPTTTTVDVPQSGSELQRVAAALPFEGESWRISIVFGDILAGGNYYVRSVQTALVYDGVGEAARTTATVWADAYGGERLDVNALVGTHPIYGGGGGLGVAKVNTSSEDVTVPAALWLPRRWTGFDAYGDGVTLAELLAATRFAEQAARVKVREEEWGLNAPGASVETMPYARAHQAFFRQGPGEPLSGTCYQITGARYRLIRGAWSARLIPVTTYSRASTAALRREPS